jgi:hypothetical protein
LTVIVTVNVDRVAGGRNPGDEPLEDIEKAVFYPEDDRYLVEREHTVKHYEVVYSVEPA